MVHKVAVFGHKTISYDSFKHLCILRWFHSGFKRQKAKKQKLTKYQDFCWKPSCNIQFNLDIWQEREKKKEERFQYLLFKFTSYAWAAADAASFQHLFFCQLADTSFVINKDLFYVQATSSTFLEMPSNCLWLTSGESHNERQPNVKDGQFPFAFGIFCYFYSTGGIILQKNFLRW